MALIATKKRSLFAYPFVLAPERYDPRRQLDAGSTETIPLGEIASVIRKMVQPSANLGRCLVLDTSDAGEGIIISRKEPVEGTNIGSAKKMTQPGDVIISRLRPYLRQVAYVDDAIPQSKDATIVCSTEFFVIRPQDEKSVAFLVPFLLTRRVQEVLAAAQEGGHHPRVNESTILTLPVPKSLVSRRKSASDAVIESTQLYRKSESVIDLLVANAEAAFK